jgi:hypothetical protein
MIALGVSVRKSAKAIEAEFTRLQQNVKDKATVRALNRALDAAQTISNREIRKTYNVKARVISKAMNKQRAWAGRLRARLEVQGFKIPLIEFSARWSRRQAGATVQVLRGGGRKTVRGAWIGKHTATGARQVFKRIGRERYPIVSLRSVSVPQAFINRAVIRATDIAVVEAFEKNFEQQLRYLTGR